MADLKEYTVNINGVETTMQLDADDLKRYQAIHGEDNVKQAQVANKARSASDKSGGN